MFLRQCRIFRNYSSLQVLDILSDVIPLLSGGDLNVHTYIVNPSPPAKKEEEEKNSIANISILILRPNAGSASRVTPLSILVCPPPHFLQICPTISDLKVSPSNPVSFQVLPSSHWLSYCFSSISILLSILIYIINISKMPLSCFLTVNR